MTEEFVKDMTEANKKLFEELEGIIDEKRNSTHYFQNKAFQIKSNGRPLRNPKEFLTMLWNADIFFHELPFMKTLAFILILVDVLLNL